MSYSVKVVNPAKKTDYIIEKLHGLNVKFTTVHEVRQAIDEKCQSDVEVPVQNIGYVEPGHGPKGKQRWLITEGDLAEMYKCHQGKKEILLSCYKEGLSRGTARKRAHSPGNDAREIPAKSSRYSNHLEKMTEVETVEDKLKEIHNKDGVKSYSDEQLRSWAHLIQMGKHTSYDTPPDKPFWRARKVTPMNSSSSNTSAGQHTPSVSSVVTISPGKRINLRGQCVEQLSRLHELLEKGAIDKAVYDEMKESIMTEVRKF